MSFSLKNLLNSNVQLRRGLIHIPPYATVPILDADKDSQDVQTAIAQNWVELISGTKTETPEKTISVISSIDPSKIGNQAIVEETISVVPQVDAVVEAPVEPVVEVAEEVKEPEAEPAQEAEAPAPEAPAEEDGATNRRRTSRKTKAE